MIWRVRRVLTGHDSEGKSTFIADGLAPNMKEVGTGSGLAITELWETSAAPASNEGHGDAGNRAVRLEPPKNGTVFRVVDFAPAAAHAAPVDHVEIQRAMGIDPATQGYARHANTHRTRTIDYAIVLDGEIDMLLDDSEIHVKAGDVLVQQATNHAWVNNGTKPCRIGFILIDAKTPATWEKNWKP